MDAEAWQVLLAAELPTPRLRALHRELGAFPSRAALSAYRGYSKAEADRIRAAEAVDLRSVLQAGSSVVEASAYPELLTHSSAAPPALFVWGDWQCVHRPCVGIVGTREATPYGRATAQKFAEALAQAGVTIVSGGAIGIDAAAHKGALAADGRTVAVLGNGIDRAYPLIHRGLFQRIRQNGCLVSQFAVGSGPSRYRFLVRNTLVAALSQVVLVVEAPERSGALFTANAANEMGRQVFVIPANIDNANYRGSHELIRAGATLVDHPDQILEDIGVEKPASSSRVVPEASPIQAAILDTLTINPIAAEFIAEKTGLNASEVMSELTMLELEGRILRDGGGYALKP